MLLPRFLERGLNAYIKFDATADSTYRIEALSPYGSQADVNVEIYSDCTEPAEKEWNESFTANVRLDFKALTASTIYLKLSNVDLTVFGSTAFYDISVCPLHYTPEANDNPDIKPLNGAVIMLGGRLKKLDRVQANIDNVTDAVYQLFSKPSYRPPENSRELIPEDLPIFELESQGDDIFKGEYGFTEEGEYRIAIYAQDNDGLKARLMILRVPDDVEEPLVVGQGSPMRTYLPIIMR